MDDRPVLRLLLLLYYVLLNYYHEISLNPKRVVGCFNATLRLYSLLFSLSSSFQSPPPNLLPSHLEPQKLSSSLFVDCISSFFPILFLLPLQSPLCPSPATLTLFPSNSKSTRLLPSCCSPPISTRYLRLLHHSPRIIASAVPKGLTQKTIHCHLAWSSTSFRAYLLVSDHESSFRHGPRK